MISIVVAIDENRAIGQENKIPWRLRSDLVMLKKLTQDHTVILGRKTYDSMVGYYNKSGRPMPGKTYIVVTRNTAYVPARDDARAVHSVPEAIELAHSLGDENILVIGGAAMYTEMLPLTERMYLTEVHAKTEADVYFPELARQEWREISREHHSKDENNEYNFDIVVLERL
jgi:dihydrofolate reductase